MPDPVLILEAMTAAALTAAAAVFLCTWPWRTPRPAGASIGSVLGVGLGLVVGCRILGLRPHWPPQEDQDRLLFILAPAVIGVELVAALAGRFRWLVWLLRLVVAAGAARILLHNSIYLTELAGPGTREWTPAQTWMILGGLAAALAGVWAALTLLVRRTPPHPTPFPTRGQGNSVPLAVALACAGAAITIMLSGYASGGQIGLSLTAALVGALAASLALPGPSPRESLLSLGIVGLFALLVMGRFFGELATSHAALLLFGTLLCWLPELPYVRRLGPRLRGLVRVAIVGVPVSIALMLALQKFVRESAGTSSDSQEPSIQDYLNSGK